VRATSGPIPRGLPRNQSGHLPALVSRACSEGVHTSDRVQFVVFSADLQVPLYKGDLGGLFFCDCKTPLSAAADISPYEGEHTITSFTLLSCFSVGSALTHANFGTMAMEYAEVFFKNRS